MEENSIYELGARHDSSDQKVKFKALAGENDLQTPHYTLLYTIPVWTRQGGAGRGVKTFTSTCPGEEKY